MSPEHLLLYKLIPFPRGILPPMPFGIRDTDRPTFSGYGLGSPLKYDRGGFLIDLLESHKDPIH